MRKAQQQDILNIIETMGQAHEEVRQALEKKALEPAKQMLVECQECAIDLGNAIEQIEGEGFISVSYLEKYCDTVYRLFEEMNEGSNPSKVTKILRKALLQVENSVKNDVKIRKEVVFLPYKASMWDSLESVYLAAREDEDCDAYCVPIPYYDRRADGSFGEMHYEGDLYPKNIEITDYRAYDLEERHPDVIYIHNPYDEWNHVTSVPERYYAKNLCHHTDKLVYIPYFILGETNADDKSDVDGMKHFCFLPGVIYADKVVVQSENMRQIYIREYIKAAKECGLTGEHIDRKFQEQKILGLGSPKVDKVLNTRKEDLEIPEEWLKIIEKPDGSWKKIIFYNTSVSALLHNDEKMLRKIESVFEIFRENKDDVVLLWRPHPLIQATIESMRPQLWEAYQEIVNRYIEEGWGIYDDSTDLTRAVVLSDAYYGDQSSVVQLCKKDEMPIMIQNVEILTKDDYILPISNGILYEGRLWFIGLNDNGIYCMDMETFQAELVQKIPWEDASCKRQQYGKIVQYKNKILLVPWLASQIVIFDMKTKELRYVEYKIEMCGLRSCYFFDGVLKDNKVFLAPFSSERIVCVNMDSEIVEYVSESLVDKFNLLEDKCSFAFGGIALTGKHMLFTMMSNDLVVKYDTELNDLSSIVVSELVDGGNGILNNNDGLWIIPKEKKEILYYDVEKSQTNVLKDFSENYERKLDWNFHQGFVDDDDLILLPRESNICLRASMKNQNIERIVLGDEQHGDDTYWGKYFRFPSVFQVESQIIITDYTGNCFVLTQGGVIDRKKIKVNYKEDEFEQSDLVSYEENNYCDNLGRFFLKILKKDSGA